MGLFTPDTPANREYAGEGYETLAAQEAIMPAWARAERRYAPYWAGTTGATMEAGLFGTGDAPGALSLANRASRGALRSAGRLAPGIQTLLDLWANQAVEENRNPYALPPGLRREVEQASLGDAALRGFGRSPADAYDVLSEIGSAAEARAGRVRGFGSNVLSAEESWLAPALRRGDVVTSTALSTPAGPKIFEPWNSYAADVYNTNYNAEAAAEIAGANNRAGIMGGLIGGGGGGGY